VLVVASGQAAPVLEVVERPLDDVAVLVVAGEVAEVGEAPGVRDRGDGAARAGGGQVLARVIEAGPDEDFESLRWAIVGGLDAAQRSVRVLTPYFIPDGALITSLNAAALRGIEVDIVLPASSDLPHVHWATFGQLWQVLDHGCRVWTVDGPFDHSKLMVVDDAWALIGSANLQNILGAVGVGRALGVDAGLVAQGIRRLKSVPGRLEKVANDRGITILVDYAHSPDALEKVLGAVRPLAQGKLISVFGCGGDRDRGKRPLMGEIAARLSDFVVLTSDNPRTEEPLAILDEVEAGVKKTPLKRLALSEFGRRLRSPEPACGYILEADRRKAIGIAIGAASAGDLVLIAGKGHEDYQILGANKIHFDDREVAREAVGLQASA